MNDLMVNSPHELLQAIPALLGREPRECVVVVGVTATDAISLVAAVSRATVLGHGSTSKAGATGLTPAEALADVARLALAREAIHAVLVTYTEEDVSLGCPAADAVLAALPPTVESCLVWACHAGRYFGPGCADVDCCPPGGHPMPPAGSGDRFAVARHLEDLGVTIPLDFALAVQPELRRSAAAARRRSRKRQRGDVQAWRREAWEHVAVSWDACASTPDLGRAIAAVQDTRVRDALIVQWLGGMPDVVRATLDGRDLESVSAVLDAALRGSGGAPPTERESTEVAAWVALLAAHAGPAHIAPVHALGAVYAWWSGKLDSGFLHAVRCLRADPDHSLGHLVAGMCERGMAPGWVGRDGENAA